PTAATDVRTPIRIASCCARGVAPTRCPVFRSCAVVPAFESAMQTTAPTTSATYEYAEPLQPTARKMRHVPMSAAIVIPESGREGRRELRAEEDDHGAEDQRREEAARDHDDARLVADDVADREELRRRLALGARAAVERSLAHDARLEDAEERRRELEGGADA